MIVVGSQEIVSRGIGNAILQSQLADLHGLKKVRIFAGQCDFPFRAWHNKYQTP
jgi:hypothetical protein